MEWIDGKRLRSVNGNGEGAGPGSGSADDLRLVEVGVRCSLEQVRALTVVCELGRTVVLAHVLSALRLNHVDA